MSITMSSFNKKWFVIVAFMLLVSAQNVNPTPCCLKPPKAEPLAASNINTTVGECQCAAFKESEVKDENEPLLKVTVFNTTCEVLGSNACKDRCAEQYNKDQSPGFICSVLKTTDSVKPSLFYRICNNSWTISPVSLGPICCDAGKPIPCQTHT